MSGIERTALMIVLLAGFGVAVSAHYREPSPDLAITTTAPVALTAATATSLTDCRAINRELAAHITRQTHALITRDRELRRLRAELAHAIEQGKGLAL